MKYLTQREKLTRRSPHLCFMLSVSVLMAISILENSLFFMRNAVLDLEWEFFSPLTAQGQNSTDRKESGKTTELCCRSLLRDFIHGEVTDGNKGRSHFRLTETKPPFMISLHDESVDNVRWSVMKTGQYYEEKLTEALQNSLKGTNTSETMVLDVGGNIGWYTLVAASMGHNVLTFEPNPLNLIRLCESLQLNGWGDHLVAVYPVGVGNEHGESRVFHEDNRNPGLGKFRPGKGINPVGNTTKLVTLDGIAEERGLFDKLKSIAFLKVDVEGYESNVFLGADKLLKSKLIKNICFEFKFSTTRKEKETLLSILINADYYLYRLGVWRGPNNADVPNTTSAASMVDAFDEIRQGHNWQNFNLWWKLRPDKVVAE